MRKGYRIGCPHQACTKSGPWEPVSQALLVCKALLMCIALLVWKALLVCIALLVCKALLVYIALLVCKALLVWKARLVCIALLICKALLVCIALLVCKALLVCIALLVYKALMVCQLLFLSIVQKLTETWRQFFNFEGYYPSVKKKLTEIRKKLSETFASSKAQLTVPMHNPLSRSGPSYFIRWVFNVE